MCLIGFVTAFYTFRMHTRVLWSAFMPLAVCFAIAMGAIIRLRLENPPGIPLDYRDSQYLRDSKYLSCILLAYAVPMPGWLLLRQLGWRLRRDSSSVGSGGRSLRLKDLFALIAIVCCLLVIAREEIEESLLATQDYIVLAPCLWIGFLRRPRSAALWSLAWCIFAGQASVVVWSLMEGVSLDFYARRFLRSYAVGFAVLMSTVVAARYCGYRMIRVERSGLGNSLSLARDTGARRE
jgi:hypothetical protein